MKLPENPKGSITNASMVHEHIGMGYDVVTYLGTLGVGYYVPSMTYVPTFVETSMLGHNFAWPHGGFQD